jgi:hypothetical protein
LFGNQLTRHMAANAVRQPDDAAVAVPDGADAVQGAGDACAGRHGTA